MTLEHTITRIIGTAELIGNRLPAYTTATTPSVLQAARTDRGRTGQGDHSDPTLRTVTQLLEPGNPDVHEAIHATLAQLQWIRKQIERTIAHNQPPRTDIEQRDHERTMRAGECLCGDADCKREQWIIPPDSGTAWAGYCGPCRTRDKKRAQRGTHVPATADCNVSAEVVGSANVTPAPPGANTSSTASVWCHICTLDHPVADGVDPWQWLEQHRTTCHG